MDMVSEIKRILKPWYRKSIVLLKGFRRIGLKTTEFSIVSNNCTGGYVYQYFGLSYCSPTAGLNFHPRDYVKVAKNPEHYFSAPLVFLSDAGESRHYAQCKDTPNYGNYPIGRVDDVEVFFVHYKSEAEARVKWEKRCSRIRYDKLFFLLVENEWTTDEMRADFLALNTPPLAKAYLRYSRPQGNTLRDEYYVPGVPVTDGIAAWRPDIVVASLPWKKIINTL